MKLRRIFVVAIALADIAATTFAKDPIRLWAPPEHLSAVAPFNEADKAFHRGDLAMARRKLVETLERVPNFWPAFYTRAKISATEGKWELVIRDCNEVMKMYPKFIPAALLRAIANAELHHYETALKEFNHVIRIGPRPDFLAEAYNDRAWLLASCPDHAIANSRKAVQDATHACNMTGWHDGATIDTLARAYAAQGDFESAIRYEEKALQRQPSKKKEARLVLFKQHQSAAH